MNIQTLRNELVIKFPERQEVVDGCLTAILSREHVLLIGPPGAAKSALARSFAQAFNGRYYEWLLTKFSTPEEIFGPMSLRALEEDRFERVVDGKLPTAEFAFLDEAFKANSAILNSMLTLMNERIYHNGCSPIHIPLVTLFAASNELPEGRELEALFDRFILRFDIQYLVQLINLRDVILAPDPTLSTKLSMNILLTAQKETEQIRVTSETLDALLAIRESCQSEGIIASDRRWKKGLKLAKASTYLSGGTETSSEDLGVLVDSLWREPKERNKVAQIVRKHADPILAQAYEVLDCAREIAQNLVSLKKESKDQYIGAAAKAIEQYTEQKNKLIEISKQGGKRAKVVITDAMREIQGLHAEAKRVAAESIGIIDRMIQAVKQ